MTFFKDKNTHCPVELSLQTLNRKWVLQIVCDMFFGKSHFSEFQKDRPELSNKALSRCLKYMEEKNLIIKEVNNNDDKKNIQYFLTDKGKSLNRIIYDLVLFTLDDEDNSEYYDEETIKETKKEFKEKLGI